MFRGLAAKYLQVHGGNTVPTEPPVGAFMGEGIVVTATGSSPLRPSSPTDPPSGVLFTASAPNSPGMLTELLLQRLPVRHRMPKAREYRTMAFVAFAGEPVVVPCAAGAYACAVRFVRAATGEATALVSSGTVEANA